MRMIAVDDERPALQALERVLHSVVEDENVVCFESAQAAIAYARAHRVDIAFLDIEMGPISGLTLAKALKDIYPDTNIIFVTGHNSYYADAFGMHASGYLIKPIDSQKVQFELNSLRNPIKLLEHNVYIQCFGNFEIFVQGIPIHFHRAKAKEALAYLVDRQGASVSKKELASILWEDTPYTHSIQSHMYVLLMEMTRALKESGAAELLIRRRGQYAVDTTKVFCDYYEFERGNAAMVNRYHGEYMNDYSWAEFTAGALLKA